MTQEEFKTTHNLPFEAGQWINEFIRYRVGTCTGVYFVEPDYYGILAVDNRDPGNGHLNDVFEWFEHSCIRDNKNLRVCELWNERFKNHLITKRGFVDIGGGDVEKIYKKNPA